MKKMTRCFSIDPRTNALLEKDSDNRGITVSANLAKIIWDYFLRNPLREIYDQNSNKLKVTQK